MSEYKTVSKMSHHAYCYGTQLFRKTASYKQIDYFGIQISNREQFAQLSFGHKLIVNSPKWVILFNPPMITDP